eukprot:gene147-248_t
MSDDKITFTEKLPKYTTERYYLLSELEDCSLFVESLDTLKISGECYMDWNDKCNKTLFVVYLLCTDKELKFLGEIAKVMFGSSHRDHSNKIFVVEAIQEQAGQMDQDLKTLLESSVHEIRSNHQLGCVVVGVSDHTSGVPALEVAVKCIQHVPYRSARVLALKDSHFLGNNPDGEPDAVSGVNQCLTASSNPYEWISQTFTTEEIGKPTSKKCKIVNEKKTESTKFYLFAFLFIFISIVVALLFNINS